MVLKGTDLTRHVQRKLEEDERIADYAIEVANESGLITLSGKVPSAEVKAAAEAIARDQEGVIGVTNSLTIDPDVKRKSGLSATIPLVGSGDPTEPYPKP